jgi:hypothetical protein
MDNCELTLLIKFRKTRRRRVQAKIDRGIWAIIEMNAGAFSIRGHSQVRRARSNKYGIRCRRD